MMWRLLAGVALLLALGLPVAGAVEPSERLANPALEARARVISQELRCLVCQNESIDESGAPLAHDLRLLVRKRLVAGDTDQQVLDYIVARYGIFVLLAPPLIPVTWLLWLGPPGLVAGTAALLLVRARQRRAGPRPSGLTAEENARAAALLGDRA
jgi:cytochrome c-type biogenesis protein CcmH